MNIDDGTICDQCNPFFGLSEDMKRCVACDEFSQGCLDCFIDEEEGELSECFECISGTKF